MPLDRRRNFPHQSRNHWETTERKVYHQKSSKMNLFH